MSDEQKSLRHYAALCSGDDDNGTWLWCMIDRTIDAIRPFYAVVENGDWELKYDPASRLMTVTATKQIVTGMRLAGIGNVPKHWIEDEDYNGIINKFLRTGEYQTVEYFVHDRY